MYKTNILHKGETHENFRSVDTPVFCHAVSAKMPGKLAAAAGFVSIGVLADLQLYSKLLKQLGMTGDIDGERSADIVNRYVLDFSTSI